MATERPAKADGERGARIVVVATTSVLAPANWREPELHATASFVEGSISWLASHRAFLDIPSKPTVMSSLDLTEEGLGILFRTSVVFLPLGAAVGGVVMAWVRRRERPTAKRPQGPPKA